MTADRLVSFIRAGYSVQYIQQVSLNIVFLVDSLLILTSQIWFLEPYWFTGIRFRLSEHSCVGAVTTMYTPIQQNLFLEKVMTALSHLYSLGNIFTFCIMVSNCIHFTIIPRIKMMWLVSDPYLRHTWFSFKIIWQKWPQLYEDLSCKCSYLQGQGHSTVTGHSYLNFLWQRVVRQVWQVYFHYIQKVTDPWGKYM